MSDEIEPFWDPKLAPVETGIKKNPSPIRADESLSPLAAIESNL